MSDPTEQAVANAVTEAWKSIPTGLSTPSEADAPWLWAYFRDKLSSPGAAPSRAAVSPQEPHDPPEQRTT